MKIEKVVELRKPSLNGSGVEPLGYAVILLLEEVRQGLIALPEEVRRRMVMSEQRATVVALGPEVWREEGKPRCVVGDHVVFSRHAGFEIPGPDGKMYRAVNDRDIFLKEIEND